MHKTTNFQSSNYFPKSAYNSYKNFNPQTSANDLIGKTSANDLIGIQIKDINLEIAVNKLIKENKILLQKLNTQKQRNYDLLQVKRKLQEDIHRLQFQIDRIGVYQNLNNKEIEIKRNQLLQDNKKIQNQLDQYFQQNKNIRAQIRKYMTQCQNLAKQKQYIVNQNIILFNQITDIKSKFTNQQNQYNELITKFNQLNHQLNKNYKQTKNQSLHDIVTIRSINQKSNLNSKQQLNSFICQSPHHQQLNTGIFSNKYYYRQEVSTNPSENKISYNSPDVKKNSSLNRKTNQVQKIYQDFYEDNVQPSPRSFNNQRIQRGFQIISPTNLSVDTGKLQKQRHYFVSNKSNNQSPVVYSYTNNYSPVIQQLKFTDQKHYNQNKKDSIDGNFLKTFQKKQLKHQVCSLRNDIVNDLLKNYKNCLQVAQKQKKNSLKIYISQVQPRLQVLYQMVLNYLQAKQMLAASCPTLRLKWQPINPKLNPSFLQHSNNSLAQSNNCMNIYKIYESIKQNSKKQANLAGQYLALFRYLTLLNKIEDGIDELLIDCIKHSALKQVNRIKKVKEGDKCDDLIE